MNSIADRATNICERVVHLITSDTHVVSMGLGLWSPLEEVDRPLSRGLDGATMGRAAGRFSDRAAKEV